MLANGNAALLCALVLFVLFVANVMLAAYGVGAIVEDLHEMLMLFGATLFFVVGILLREARAKKTQS